VSKEFPECEYEVSVNGNIYLVAFDQEVTPVSAVQCKEHPGHIADMTTETEIYEIRDQDSMPLNDSVDLDALKTKILEAIGDGRPKCIECLGDTSPVMI